MGGFCLTVKLSDSVNVNRAKPEYLYTSTMHGDETVGYILMLHLIRFLVKWLWICSTGSPTSLNNYQIYINPLANPDGTYAGGN